MKVFADVLLALLLGGLVASTSLGARVRASAAGAIAVPPPRVDASTSTLTGEVAVLAGGCFWGVQGVFQHVTGVTSAVSGYAGGEQHTANYRVVELGTSGHAEAVEITFDPAQVTYGRLLQIFFAVAHDPTEFNRQGPDSGPQYRSAIFPRSEDQARIAAAYIAQLNEAGVFGRRLATTIEPSRPFYRAEAEHQDFLTRHPTYPYIVVNDLPKLEALKHQFGGLYRAEPALVLGKSPAR